MPTTPGRATLPAPVRPAISLTQRALELHERAVVIDAHCDIAQAMCDDGLDIGAPRGTTHFSLSRARRGGLAAEFFALFVAPDEYPGPAAWRRTLALMRVVKLAARVHPAHFGIARTAAEIRAHHAAGRVAGILAVEGAHGLGARTERRIRARIAVLAERGVRSFGLTWNNSNALATAAAAPVDHGLSPLGGIAVRDLERLGVLVDVSHASPCGVWDMIELSRVPVFASHAGATGVKRHYRNLDDGQLRAIGRGGGVVGVIFCTLYLGSVFDSLEVVADHIEHVADVAGEDAVALGSDMDGFVPLPRGFRDVRDLPRLTEVLWRRGFGARRLRKLLGENWLRYFALATPGGAGAP